MIRALVIAWLIGGLVAACGEQTASDLAVERLPDVRPNLPAVPTLPPPPHPTQYSDSTYSVFGLRQRLNNTIDTDVELTAHIVEIYQAPECPEGDECPTPAAPHMWVADVAGETDREKRLTVVGYAENQASIDEAVEAAERGRPMEFNVEMGEIPIPVDFAVGAKIKLRGRFTRVSGTGFNISDGLIEYRSHDILEAPPGEGS